MDFTIIYSTVPANVAAMFTKNHFCGAPIYIGKVVLNLAVDFRGWYGEPPRHFAPSAPINKVLKSTSTFNAAIGKENFVKEREL